MIIRNNITMGFVQKRAAEIEQQALATRRRHKLPKIKPSTIAIYASVFLLILAIVFTSYQSPNDNKQVANAGVVDKSKQLETMSVDDVIASSIAANVAKAASLPVANEVANFAVSAKVNNDIIHQTGMFKPQVVGSTVAGRSVISYTVQSQDTLDSLSAQFGISKQTIMWANNMSTESLYDGQVLQILPIDGVIHDVGSDETIDSIAEKYSVDRTRLILYNDLDISGLTIGAKIILPNATLPSNERPGYIAPVVRVYGYYGGDTSFISTGGDFNDAVRTYLPHLNSFYTNTYGNLMYPGQCTWWAWERRYAMGIPLPSGLTGNAGSWGAQLGYDGNPTRGAVAESYGHVTVVESVNYNAAGNIESITISEMNNGYPYNVSIRTIPGANIGNYWYIH